MSTLGSPRDSAAADRYPLPDWKVDTNFKRDLTMTVADAIGDALMSWPADLTVKAHAERVTAAVRTALNPHLDWLHDSVTDGFSYPGDVLVSYVSQLTLTRPGEVLDVEHYRELLRSYRAHLVMQAHKY
ncbi:hypothetical protein [Glycomyces sp. NPDC048151]|uniref:hypothetical protein n=1 Tax=Glycomyces sp. NPDC048151 TaxID=3364002 RepID=UPI00371DBDD9